MIEFHHRWRRELCGCGDADWRHICRALDGLETLSMINELRDNVAGLSHEKQKLTSPKFKSLKIVAAHTSVRVTSLKASMVSEMLSGLVIAIVKAHSRSSITCCGTEGWLSIRVWLHSNFRILGIRSTQNPCWLAHSTFPLARQWIIQQLITGIASSARSCAAITCFPPCDRLAFESLIHENTNLSSRLIGD
jgi:hypothetical protein